MILLSLKKRIEHNGYEKSVSKNLRHTADVNK